MCKYTSGISHHSLWYWDIAPYYAILMVCSEGKWSNFLPQATRTSLIVRSFVYLRYLHEKCKEKVGILHCTATGCEEQQVSPCVWGQFSHGLKSKLTRDSDTLSSTEVSGYRQGLNLTWLLMLSPPGIQLSVAEQRLYPFASPGAHRTTLCKALRHTWIFELEYFFLTHVIQAKMSFHCM